MPATNPRVNIVLEKPLFKSVQRLARKDGVSLSLKVRDLIREALDLYEDVYLSEVAREREKTFDRSQALSHERVWGHLAKKKAA